MTPITLTLAPGEVRRIDAAGFTFRYLSASGGDQRSTLEVDPGGDGGWCPLRPGQGFEMPEQMNAWALRNASTAPLRVELLIANLAFNDLAPQAINPADRASLEGRSFVGKVSTSGASFNCTQLWNPTASGRLLLVYRTWIWETPSWWFQIGRSVAQLGPMQGSGFRKRFTPASLPAGAGQLRYETLASVGAFDNILSYNTGAGVFDIYHRDPFVLEPGTGLVTFSNQPGENQTVIYEWTEVEA